MAQAGKSGAGRATKRGPPGSQKHRQTPGSGTARALQERCKLVRLIERGPEVSGFVGAVWTANRIRALALRELEIRVSLATVKRFLHQEGFSVQKPEVAATQKNQKAVAGFRGGWTNLKKGQSEPAQP